MLEVPYGKPEPATEIVSVEEPFDVPLIDALECADQRAVQRLTGVEFAEGRRAR
jgi:hypothetical protein